MIHSYLLNYVYGTPWALLPEKLAVITGIARRHAAGEKIDPAEVQAAVSAAAARNGAPRMTGGVAIVPIMGLLVPHGDMLMESSGAMSVDRVSALFHAALADPSVGAIVLNLDSPGGNAQGIDELATDIFQSRGQKPIVAVANYLAASGAYWLATSADELLVSPSAHVGSIGAYTAHEDWSKADELAGVKTTMISAGKFKVEGNPFEPLSDDARAAMQTHIDDIYNSFVKAVARNRGVGAGDVRGGFGEGRIVGAKEAVAQGMADRIGTLDDAINRAAQLARRSPAAESTKTGTAAESDPAHLSDMDYRRRRARALSNR